ncbi:MAG TPA: hypothetical protein VJK71_04735 [Gemmatimonadales bacterium]|nr:hypothetical protein [Gemmatimonadales bacterium]
MTTPPPRDWEKEMAEIDRLIAKQPVVPPARPAVQPSSLPAVRGRHAALTAWLRVLLGVAVAAGMTQWPYAHGCGFQLYLYLAAAGVVVLAGLWGMITSWKRRLALAHVVSLGVTLWGAALAGRVILDRTGYVKQPLSWICPAPGR